VEATSQADTSKSGAEVVVAPHATTGTDPPAPSLGRRISQATVDHRRGFFILGATVLLAVPLFVALIALLHPRWYPLLDMAWTEMRIRDVWSSHPPLLGLAGRIGPFGHQGSHPGPLSFYALWPFYQLFGATSWAMEAASVALHVVAIGVILWIANRRGGLALALGVTAVLAILLRGLGAALLTQPWNPYMPVLWWVVFLLAVWSVFCDDLALLPLAALAGSFCAQTEVAYLGLTIGLGGLAVAIVGIRTYVHRKNRDVLRRAAVWCLAAAAIAVVIWIPPVVEQLTTSRGNLSVLFDYFTHPPQSPAGLHEAWNVMLAHLNPMTPLTKPLLPTSTRDDVTTGYALPGLAFLILWAGTAVAAWRLRIRPLVRLNMLLGVAVLLGVFSISRIFGLLWYYLVLWAWGIDALMVVAVGWTVVAVAARRLDGHDRVKKRAQIAGSVFLAGTTLVVTTLFAINAAKVESPTPRLAEQLRVLVGPTVTALERRPGPDGGRRGRYLVTFNDPNSIGAQAFGLMNELERQGFDVGAPDAYRSPVTPHRVLNAARATAIVHLAFGSDIEKWRALPGAQEIAYSDPRNARERAHYDQLYREVVAELNAAGLSSLAPQIQANLFSDSLNPRVPIKIRTQLGLLDDLGLPAAVFVAPHTVEG
jgi:hypothetical protein